MTNCEKSCPVIQANHSSRVGSLEGSLAQTTQLIGDGVAFGVTPERFSKILDGIQLDPADFNSELDYTAARTDAVVGIANSDPEVLRETAELLEEFNRQLATARKDHAEISDSIKEGCPGKLSLKGGGYCVTICRSPEVIESESVVPSIVTRQ